jgi:hypothetical protein
MKLPQLAVNFPELPRHVIISSSVTAVSALIFLALYFTLGTGLVHAIASNARLKSDIAQASKSVEQLNQDFAFVSQNQQRFEQLIQGERLVAHTRRDAIDKLRELAAQYGITQLTWEIGGTGGKGAPTAAGQKNSQAYKVDADTIALRIGAPLDGQIYKFLLALTRDFPGAIVISSVSLERSPRVTDGMLATLAQGGAFVSGEARVIWRTAQTNESEKKP